MSRNPEITEQEWTDWKMHPVTVQYHKRLEQFLEDLKQQWVSGNFTSSTVDETAQMNASNIGKAQMITDIVLATATQSQRESMAQTEAEVVALGNTAYSDQPVPWCQVGDKVVFAKYAGTICQGNDGKTYRLINDLDVKAILETSE